MKLNPKAMDKTPPKECEHKGVSFKYNISWPKSRESMSEPCRALVTPRNPLTGKLISKSQLYGGNSQYPVDLPVYGVDEQDIRDNKLEEAMDRLIVQMKEKKLLPDKHPLNNAPADSMADLGEVAHKFKDIFFGLHKSEWSERTDTDYRHQYDKLVAELRGIPVKNLDQEGYKELQNTICRKALKTSRAITEWKYGEQPPKSAEKRMMILYRLIQDLKETGEVSVPVIPTRYNSKPSRLDMLLIRTDSARSLPVDLLRKECAHQPLAGQAGLMADDGLRISEASGLLCDSIRSIDTSQGTMYYLVINGQISRDRRTEITKTDAGYRFIPVSQELGRSIYHGIEAEGGDQSLNLMNAGRNGDRQTQAKDAVAWRNQMSEEIPQLLRQKEFVQELTDHRPYQFNKKAQDKELSFNLTCHALRRNFCTWCHCEAGLEEDEIFRQMGHAKKGAPRRTYGGLTEGEIRLMCLRKHVSDTLYHEAHPLHYNVGGGSGQPKLRPVG